MNRLIDKRPPFVQIENACFVLPPAAFKTYAAILSFANFQTGAAWPALDTITERACMSRRTVIDAIKVLEAVGLLTVTRTRGADGKNMVNQYCVFAPSQIPDFDQRVQNLHSQGVQNLHFGAKTDDQVQDLHLVVVQNLHPNEIQGERDPNTYICGPDFEGAPATLEEGGTSASREGAPAPTVDKGAPDGGTEPAVSFQIDTHAAAPPDAADAEKPPAKPKRKRGPRVTAEERAAKIAHLEAGIQRVLDAWDKRDAEMPIIQTWEYDDDGIPF